MNLIYFRRGIFRIRIRDRIPSFELFLLLRPLGTRSLPLLAGPAAALLLSGGEVVGSKRGDLVTDAADGRELLPRGFPVLLGEGQSVEVLFFEARPLPRSVHLLLAHDILPVKHFLGRVQVLPLQVLDHGLAQLLLLPPLGVLRLLRVSLLLVVSGHVLRRDILAILSPTLGASLCIPVRSLIIFLLFLLLFLAITPLSLSFLLHT